MCGCPSCCASTLAGAAWAPMEPNWGPELAHPGLGSCPRSGLLPIVMLLIGNRWSLEGGASRAGGWWAHTHSHTHNHTQLHIHANTNTNTHLQARHLTQRHSQTPGDTTQARRHKHTRLTNKHTHIPLSPDPMEGTPPPLPLTPLSPQLRPTPGLRCSVACHPKAPQ